MSQSRTDDLVRAVAVLASALLQFAAGAVGGIGVLTGESVGEVARSYPNPLLPGGTAFMIWNLIYVAMLVYAVWQLLPSQRGEAVHRRTGWLIAIAGVLNAAWVLLFTAEQVAASQIVIVLLLGTLAVAWSRSTDEAADAADRRSRRWLLWGPLALYTGWVAVATVVGALTTLAAVSDDGAGTAVAVVALAVTAVAAAWVVAKGVAVAAFAAAAVWALVWIAVSAEPAVTVAAVVAAVLIAAALALRIARSHDRSRAAFG
jgi:hypothetical protein